MYNIDKVLYLSQAEYINEIWLEALYADCKKVIATFSIAKISFCMQKIKITA